MKAEVSPLPGPGPAEMHDRASSGTRASLISAGGTLVFFGEVLLALGRLLRGRSCMQRTDLLAHLDRTGPLALPIVVLTCFLIGLMLAYMGGAQLQRIGAQSFIADVVTVGVVRELAGLMTGVILAGRIGAAFAAELASMQSPTRRSTPCARWASTRSTTWCCRACWRMLTVAPLLTPMRHAGGRAGRAAAGGGHLRRAGLGVPAQVRRA
jgi:hypothetical protein